LWLAAVTKGYACPLWLTLRQALELGGHFRKGEAGELVVYVDRIHAAYIASRIMVLKDDKRAIFSAAAHAQRVADYLHSAQPQQATQERAAA
jgi:antirestriction protein ArdC